VSFITFMTRILKKITQEISVKQGFLPPLPALPDEVEAIGSKNCFG